MRVRRRRRARRRQGPAGEGPPGAGGRRRPRASTTGVEYYTQPGEDGGRRGRRRRARLLGHAGAGVRGPRRPRRRAATRPWRARTGSPTRSPSCRPTSSARPTSTSARSSSRPARPPAAGRAARPRRLPRRRHGGVDRRRARGRPPEGRRARRAETIGAPSSARTLDRHGPGRRARLRRLRRPRRHPDRGLRAGAGQPRRRGAAASSRASSGQLPQLLGVSLDDLSALAERRARPRRDRRARRPAPRSRSRWRTAPRRRRRSTSCASGSRRSCGRSAPTRDPASGSQVPLAGGVQGWRLPLSPEAGVVYGVDGDLAIVGTSVPAVDVGPAPASPRCRRRPPTRQGTPGCPSEVTSVIWVNLQERHRRRCATPAPSTDAPPETLANLRPLKSIAAWTTAGDDPDVRGLRQDSPR